ncbi:MAG TPA: DedA family protein [Solimonas sp.]|nr:DedA family protein [Solimonas sp.]
MHALVDWVRQLVSQLGYGEIVLLMAMESSIFPVPSELVMIPAGLLAARGGLDPVLAVLSGGLGSVLGASANYAVGRFAGRAFLLRYGRYVLMGPAKYHEAEALFLRNAAWATFLGRFIPVIRHLISLPAGVFGMRLPLFLVLTAAGATLWCAVLVSLGYFLGEPALELVGSFSREASLIAVALLAAFAAWFLLRRRRGEAA